jgi:N utilization substance protein A
MATDEPKLSGPDAGRVRHLFLTHVPEVATGRIRIKAIARKPGVRTKIALDAPRPIDVVAACLGSVPPTGASDPSQATWAARRADGSMLWGSQEPLPDRIQRLVAGLAGAERLDIVRWHEDAPSLIQNALAPAAVERLALKPLLGRALAVVRDDQLSLAIGRDGVNVQLAAALTGWDIEILTEQELDQVTAGARDSFRRIPGIQPDQVAALIDAGFLSHDDLSLAEPARLAELLAISQDRAAAMAAFAKQAASLNDEQDQPPPRSWWRRLLGL